MTDWISFKERLPDKDREILGFEEGRIYVFSYRMNAFHECSSSEWAVEVNPTHWMLLPDSPKE